MIDLQRFSLHQAYARRVKPAEVIEQVFAAIESAGDPGIFISLRERDEVLRDAEALGLFDPVAKPLFGLPFAVKDNIDVAGIPTTAACPAFAYMPKKTAFAVRKLLEAGAILVGKTNLDQFATGLVGVRTPYPVPRNAVLEDLVPGGSSSGSAVAVARGLVTFALGTDTAGSGRVPAALNNIVGLKPSLGAVSTNGVVPACRTLDCVSVFANSVDDAWAAFSVMASYDAGDPYSRALTLTPLGAPQPVLRVGVPSKATLEFFGDRQAERAYEITIEDLERLGAKLIEFDFAPFREIAELLYEGPWIAERYQAIRAFIEASPEALHPVTRQIIEGATRFSAADTFARFYKLAELRRSIEPTWRNLDMLAVPSIPAVYTFAEVKSDPVALNSRLGFYTNFVNLLDLSALAIPGKFRADKRPSGVTLIAPAGQDGFLASFGRLLHQAAGVTNGATAFRPRYETLTYAPQPDGIELVVVGAHMSGLPLNKELQAEGAAFVRHVETAPHYRLYALASDKVARPGLLRVAQNEGSKIAAEVWALSPAGFGKFVSRIPSPLGIGTLELIDGTSSKGFLVEAAAVETARDISNFGGWRAYLSSLS
jgi:allophanate hydrolase